MLEVLLKEYKKFQAISLQSCFNPCYVESEYKVVKRPLAIDVSNLVMLEVLLKGGKAVALGYCTSLFQSLL